MIESFYWEYLIKVNEFNDQYEKINITKELTQIGLTTSAILDP